MKNILNYFFSFDSQLNQRKYIIHYFLDFLLFSALLIFLIVPIYILDQYTFGTKILGIHLSVFLYIVGAVVGGVALCLNRLSILYRRLKFVKMSPLLAILIVLPIVSQIFDAFLLFYSDSRVAQKN